MRLTRLPRMWRPVRRQLSSKRYSEDTLAREYQVRSSVERLILRYSEMPVSPMSINALCKQSELLSPQYIVQSAKDTVENLVKYNAQRLTEFRTLPYLVILNPAISDSYELHLKSMSQLMSASLDLPQNLSDNNRFVSDILMDFLQDHSDTLPDLSKGFGEVKHLLTEEQIATFLDSHLRDRIMMRLFVHQHEELSRQLNDGTYTPGSPFNGVVKLLNIPEVMRKSCDLANSIFMMTYDQPVSVNITSVFKHRNGDITTDLNQANFPYIEYHLDYIFIELLKNAFRAQQDHKITEPVEVVISVSEDPSFLQIKIADKGKGIPPTALHRIFDYSFSTFENNEGDSYKTLNVAPGFEGNTVAGIGFGVPLLKNYIELFDNDAKESGSLTFQPYNNYGTDAYVKLYN